MEEFMTKIITMRMNDSFHSGINFHTRISYDMYQKEITNSINFTSPWCNWGGILFSSSPTNFPLL